MQEKKCWRAIFESLVQDLLCHLLLLVLTPTLLNAFGVLPSSAPEEIRFYLTSVISASCYCLAFMEPEGRPGSLGKEMIFPLSREMRCCYGSCELPMGRKTVPGLHVCKSSSAKGTSLFPLLSRNSLQELVTPTAPPWGPGVLHPVMAAAFSHLAIELFYFFYLFFGKRPLLSSNRAAKRRDSPCSILILPGEPSNHHYSKEAHLL